MNYKLLAARKQKCWTIEDVCRRAGVSDRAYRTWEKGERTPQLSSLALLCQVFELSAADLGFEQSVQVEQEQTTTLLLTTEQIAALRALLGDRTMAHTDPGRRNALKQIAAIIGSASTLTIFEPEPWERLSLATTTHTAMNATSVAHFRAMSETCWNLSNSGELEVAQEILSTFLPRLVDIAPHQSEVAHLASESLRLRSILVGHQLKLTDKVALCEQAVSCAKLTHEPNTLVGALAELAVGYRYTEQHKEEMRTCEEALYYSRQVSPLLRARIYAHAAKVFAEERREEEAHFYLQLAYKTFPSHPGEDPAFSLANASFCNFFSISLYEGLMYLGMDKYQDAWNTFENIKQQPPEIIIPERTRLEIVNYQGRAAALSNNLDQYVLHLEDGLTGALTLKSRKRYDEALSTYRQVLPANWRREPAIKNIAEQYHLDKLK